MIFSLATVFMLLRQVCFKHLDICRKFSHMRAARSDSSEAESCDMLQKCRRRICCKKSCDRCCSCLFVVLCISLMAEIIGSLAFLAHSPTPSVSEEVPKVAYWCSLEGEME